MVIYPNYDMHLKHYNNSYLVDAFQSIRSGKCLMSSKRRKYFVYAASKKHSNIYIKDEKFIKNYINIIQDITNTTISFYQTKNKIIFNIVDNSEQIHYNVYRAVVLTRFLTLKQFYLYPLAIVELSKYLNLNETLYLTNYMYPTSCYWGLYLLFDRLYNYYLLNFKDNILITSFKKDFKDDSINVFNGYFYLNIDNNVYKHVDLHVKYKIHYLLLHGLFKEAADYYNSLK